MVRFIPLLGLILVTGGLYLNSFPGDFHYDDFPLLLGNEVVTGDSFSYELLLQHHWGRPLTLLSFHWEYQIFGADPFYFHLFSFCLHILIVILVYGVVRIYLDRQYLALVTALLFAIHPIQSQAVNYIWSRSVLLMSCFALLSLLLCRRFPVVSVLLFQLAVWSRADGLMLAAPLIFLVPGKRTLILFITGINSAILAGYLYLTAPQEFAWTYSEPFTFWLAAPLGFWKYLGLMVWPSRLTIDHANLTGSAFTTLAGTLAIVVLLLVVFSWKRKQPFIFLSVCWIVVFLAPSLLIPNSDLVNESRSYLAFAGFALLLALGSEKLGKLVSGRVIFPIWTLPIVWLLLYAPFTFERNEVWQDDAKLWREAVDYSPTELRATYNLGVALVKAGKRERAEEVFEQALKLSPFDDMSYAALGYCAESRGSDREALQFYRKAVHLNPDNFYASLRISAIGAEDSYIEVSQPD